MNDRARGQNDGAIQRAQLFASVDELLAWKKSFDKKQAELIAWMAKVENDINALVLGGHVLIDADTVIDTRLDIINKRLRKLENGK